MPLGELCSWTLAVWQLNWRWGEGILEYCFRCNFHGEIKIKLKIIWSSNDPRWLGGLSIDDKGPLSALWHTLSRQTWSSKERWFLGSWQGNFIHHGLGHHCKVTKFAFSAFTNCLIYFLPIISLPTLKKCPQPIIILFPTL